MKQFKIQQEQKANNKKKSDDLRTLHDIGFEGNEPVVIYEPDSVVQVGKTIVKTILGIVLMIIICIVICCFLIYCAGFLK